MRTLTFLTASLVSLSLHAAEPAKAPAPKAPAGSEHAHDHGAPAEEPKEFVELKRLVGQWEGKTKMGDQEIPVAITYELTAAGSAVVERLFPGTPHEMLSVFTHDGAKVEMTHYCSAGNHPRMALRKAQGSTLAFEMAGTDGLHSAKEMHMHAMSVTLVDENHLKEQWTSFENGSKKDDKLFDLTRKK